MKNILNFTKNNEVNQTEETKEEVVMNTKFSLKKKLAVAGGLVALVIGGAIALYNKGKQSTDESCNNDEDENDEDFDDDEVETIEVETNEVSSEN